MFFIKDAFKLRYVRIFREWLAF
ncbi:hypothetical protein BVI1335_1270024 [Burkholderia vietnamiensis]|nr:hypothetical protein BVI1335_1270024 [Burkholderia vietnamiensis]